MKYRSLRAPGTSVKHHDRGITVVFGSDGQVSLIDFDGGIASQTAVVFPTFTAGSTGSLTPDFEATPASSTGRSSSFTPTPTTTPLASSLVASSYGPSPTATDTDTDLPSIPTVNYPTPSATAVSNPKDHGVGAPFYLAIVLASISFIGCVSALVAWWIRSRGRRHDIELNDPWHHGDSVSDTGSPSADEFGKGTRADMKDQTRPYYLPASIVRRGSSDLLTVPHTIPALEGGASQHDIRRSALAAGRYPSWRRTNDPPPRSLSPQPNVHQNLPSSQTTDPYLRPSAARSQTGLTVQESTRTLGRLRVANRAPGDVTSGDESGMNTSRLSNSVELAPVASIGGPKAVLVGETTLHTVLSDRRDPSVRESDSSSLEPPGPATVSWGRRTETVAALRRTRRRTPGTTVRTYKNAKYGGYWYPTQGRGSDDTTWQVPVAINQEGNDKVFARPPLDPLGWTRTLKSSFWQAVDTMTGSQSSGSPPSEEGVGNGSRFTPAPRRAVSRYSSGSPTISSSLPDVRTIRSQEAETNYELTLPERISPIQGTSRSSIRSKSGSYLTGTDESDMFHVSKDAIRGIDSSTPTASHLDCDLEASANRRHPDSLKTDTSSMYSASSAVARANLRKYGYVYEDPIPSSWSALGETRESQLDLARTYLPRSRPMPNSNSNLGALSMTPSQLTLEWDLQPASTSTHTSTLPRLKGDRSFDRGLQPGKDMNTASYMETTGPVYGLSRNDTIRSGRGTNNVGIAPSQASSTTLSTLSRKKGLTAKRKRPRPPPRVPSSASSVQSMESGLSLREVGVRRALLERRQKIKAAGGVKGGEGRPHVWS